jgi:hypothetical protein
VHEHFEGVTVLIIAHRLRVRDAPRPPYAADERP